MWRGPSEEKAGPMMFNAQLGGAVGLHQSNGVSPDRPQANTAAGSVELAFAITPDRRGYVFVPFQYQGPGYFWDAFMFSAGFEYDIKLAEKGPFLTARIQAGYGLVWSLPSLLHFGFVIPELGLKWVLKKRWNIGFTWFSMPIAFGSDDSHQWATPLFYRVALNVGVNF
jgi:hypothetical protein